MENNKYNSESESKLTAFLLCYFFGYLGVHRFYVGKIGTGILYLFTGGLFGIGILVDLIMILCNSFKDKKNNLLNKDVSIGVLLLIFFGWAILLFILFYSVELIGLITAIFTSLLLAF